jgi:antitoxin MazE
MGLAPEGRGDYGNYSMKTAELKVTRIGNSRGVRLPAAVLRRYRIGDTLTMELRPDEIALRARRAKNRKLTWAETYKEMAQADEDWSDWESLPEGLRDLPGEGGK